MYHAKDRCRSSSARLYNAILPFNPIGLVACSPNWNQEVFRFVTGCQFETDPSRSSAEWLTMNIIISDFYLLEGD
jgi:hypothetical protein